MSTIREKVLFVGGCADGQWLEKPVTEYFKVARRDRPIRYLSDCNDHFNPMECDIYRRERIRSGGCEFECYALESLQCQDFIACLINGYGKSKATP